MSKILVFGNSGSGKTTLAKRLDSQLGLAHLDLDTLAWMPGTPPQRRPLVDSKQSIQDFTARHENWVVEGCYADLIQLLVAEADEMVYLQPTEDECVANARSRPFEPHKYSSEAAQNRNIEMLVGWIREYSDRNDVCSRSAHEELFKTFTGRKTLLINREQAERWYPYGVSTPGDN